MHTSNLHADVAVLLTQRTPLFHHRKHDGDQRVYSAELTQTLPQFLAFFVVGADGDDDTKTLPLGTRVSIRVASTGSSSSSEMEIGKFDLASRAYYCR